MEIFYFIATILINAALWVMASHLLDIKNLAEKVGE